MIRVTSEEVAWFEAFDRKLLAIIVFDRTDSDFGFLILGRDARRIFRCVDVSTVFYPTRDQAEEALEKEIAKYKHDGKEIYPQGDEKEPPNEILIPCVKDDELHPYFKVLANEPGFEAARNLIREIAYTFTNPDSHYIREFQTQGFNARLWELYLYVYLYNAGFEFIRGQPSPDYHLSFFGEECLIEAVTVNPSQNPDRPDLPPPKSPYEVNELRKEYLPIKYGSALFSKLKKRYWEMDHVKGKPLLIAIHDFHMPGSMTWSRTALYDYLYGIRATVAVDENDCTKPKMEKVENHSWEGKIIPSCFFAQPDAENISAVLFTNAATISKFNRMGKLARLGSKSVKLIRQGVLYNPDPNALGPIPFTVDVDSPQYEESWSDSLVMFHNPNAKYSVNPDCFWDISHISYDKDKESFFGDIRPYDVLASITITSSPQG